MKLRYLNGEKVYVEDYYGMMGIGQEWDRGDGTFQVLRHRDLIKCLNRLFKAAEENPENVGHDLLSLLRGMGLHFESAGAKPNWEVFEKDRIVFDDPQKVKPVKQPSLRQGKRKAAPCLPGMPMDQQVQARQNITKDTFVNLNMLYEQIDKPLNELRERVEQAERWLRSDCINDCWLPEKEKQHIKWAIGDSKEALEMISKIENIIYGFREKACQTSTRSLIPRTRIDHLNVVRGGQCKPLQRPNDDILTPAGKAFMEKERAEK